MVNSPLPLCHLYYHDGQLSVFCYGQVCRVLRGYYLSALELVSAGDGGIYSESSLGGTRSPRQHLKEARLRVEEALSTCLLPSLQLIPANPAVGQEIWEVLSLLPYEVGNSNITFSFFFPFCNNLLELIDNLANEKMRALIYIGTVSSIW